ncbi:hypothetical protein [Bosea sp. NBC_00550]|uniref:hypothetical protein n=1 Tax=Bosea sp. NBC_00550 TaxID=2969621 RepID=UPI002231426E|nr:hypothetical protein [Bosea sp. NBC_00550]UZF90550.1 hypothetical protein NWE53_15520 [Bosea sp. NBC_00550]
MSRLQAGLDRLRPWLARALAIGRNITARIAGIDAVPLLISCADRIEASFRWTLRLGRHLLPRRGLGLTGALAWRCAAALGGIGMTAILVTGLSAKDEDQPRLASLALPSANPMAQGAATPRRPRQSATAEDWVAIPRPMAMFSLEASELGREAPSLETRRSQDGSRREDLLSFGSFAEPKAHLVLRLATGEGAAAGSRSFMVALVHDTAQRGHAIERSSAPIPTETRFGPLETADVVLGEGAESRSCVAFRTPPGEATFAMSGWWCAASKPSDRRQLTCLIDRLDLANAGADQELRAVFASSELKRQPGCAPPRLSASGRKTSWLDVDGNLPALRMKTASADPARPASEIRRNRDKPARRQP